MYKYMHYLYAKPKLLNFYGKGALHLSLPTFSKYTFLAELTHIPKILVNT